MITTNPEFEIVICTERGYLEALSKLLIFSIRTLDGPLKNVPIVSYSPRKGRSPKRSTVRFFEQHQVEYEDRILNTEFVDYPLSNKPIVCAHREQKTNAKFLVFLDSDTVFLQRPLLFENSAGHDLMMRPVEQKGIGTDRKFSGANGNYWRELYKVLKVTDDRTVRTVSENSEILEYYNSGMVISKTGFALFEAWNKNFHTIMGLGLKPASGISFVEQSVLSATISSLGRTVQPLPKDYNCPADVIENTANENYRLKSFEEIVLLHYHKVFMNKRNENPIYDQLQKFSRGQSINRKITDFSVIRKLRSRKLFFKAILKNLLGE